MSLLMQFSGLGRILLNLSRGYARYSGVRKKKPVTNPGVDMRLSALSEAEKDTEFETEDFDDFESDFMNTAQVYDEHLREMKSVRNIRDFKIVERKYFKKAKEPSFLTWEEKEQIRYLHDSDPDKWDSFSLAESFPVSETAVKKILKAKWQPKDEERILKYNESVKRNWKLLEQGKLEIDENLKTHLKKFTSRKHLMLSPPSEKLVGETNTAIQTKSREFVDTVEGYIKKKMTDSSKNSNVSHPQMGSREFTARKETEGTATGANVSRSSYHGNKMRMMVRGKRDKNSKGLQITQDSELVTEGLLPGTYCVGDSHYDTNDGEFLFRVPSLKNQ